MDLKRAVQDMKVMGLNSGWVELGVYSPSIEVQQKPKMMDIKQADLSAKKTLRW